MKETLTIIGSLIGVVSFVGAIVISVVGKLLKDKGIELDNKYRIEHLEQSCKTYVSQLDKLTDRINKHLEDHS